MEDRKTKTDASDKSLSPGPDARDETFKEAASLSSGPFSKTSKKIRVTMQETRISLFGSIVPSIIMEERKSHSGGQKNVEDLIGAFSEAFVLWKDVVSKLTKGKPTGRGIKEVLMRDISKPEFASCYGSVCDLFQTIVNKLENFSFEGSEDRVQKAFSEELILVAELGIGHTNALVIDTLSQALDSTETAVDQKALDEHFLMLHIFHEFFFALAKLRCNPILSDRQLTILHEICKGTLGALQMKVQSNIRLLLETPVQASKLRAIARLVYYVMQTVAVLSVFGESEGQTASKYQNILERFKTIFALISHSGVFDKVFTEQYDFESSWNAHKGKYTLASFNQKRLSIFLLDGRLPEETGIPFSLKYLVVYYNFKVLKLISQRLQVSYDEHILSIFSILIHKNRSILGSLLAQKDRQNSLKVMLLINENVYILKSYIMNLAYFSDNLDPMQRQAKYDTIKDTTIDCLALAIKSGVYWSPETVEEVNQLTISEPKDFVALVFKALLLYKKVKKRHASVKFSHEMIRHINILATDLASRPIPTDDAVCFYSYRLCFLQFLSEWDLDSLKEKYMKYSEEMNRYLADFDEEGVESSPVLQRLKFRCQDLALELYVRLAQLDCEPPIEATIGFIRESFTNEKKLYKYFYIMFCLICQKKVPAETFKGVMSSDAGLIKEVLGPLKGSKETGAFLQKEGMGVVFLIYKNATASYIQTKEQRHTYEQELNTPLARKSIGTAEVNNYVVETYLKKLDTTILSYETLLQDTESFVCALHSAVPIAEFFLMNPEFDMEFYQQVINLPCGRSLILGLLRILCKHISSALAKPELVEKFVALITDLFQCLMSVQIGFEEEKPFVLSVVGIVETLIAESGPMCREVREILFHRAVLALFLETCQKDHYDSDIETFLRFLKLMKLVVKGNRLFYESPENKSHIYSFVLAQFDKFMRKKIVTMSVVASLLQYLIDIGLETDLDLKRPQPAIIKEPSAVEAYFGILVRCFKSMTEESNSELKQQVLVPLEALSNSLMNDCVLSKVAVQELLMKILKRANEKEFQRQVSSHIGRISSTNTTAKHIQLLMRHFLKSSKYVAKPYEEDYYLSLLDTLIDSISGESIRSLYFFSGLEKSFIKLKSPHPTPGDGICWTGHIRLERGNKERKQCIFSFLKIKPSEVKGIELYVQDRKLVYKMIKLYKGDSSVSLTLPNIEVREDAWHHITMAHIGRELIVHVNEASCTLDAPTQSFARNKYNCSTIGAAMDPSTNQYHSHFFGEMSALYFFCPSPKFKEVIKDLAHRGQHLTSMYKHEGIDNESHIYSQDPSQYKGLKYIDRDFISTTHFVLDPKCNIFNKQSNEDLLVIKGKSLNMLESLQETQLFFNRPAKDVFYNLGGFKTTLPLLASRIQFKSSTVERDSRVCSSILKLLHALCLNNELDLMNFLIVEHGIDILKHLFEKVGEHGKFSLEFVVLLFKILELPVPSAARLLNRIVPALIEKIVFNANIWSNSDYSVQKCLMERAHDLLTQRDRLQFSPGEPYKCMLRMLYDYFAPEEVEDPELKKFLVKIRLELTQIIIQYFQQYGAEDTVPTLVEFLLPRHDYLYAIRDLLYIVMLYQSPPERKALTPSVLAAQLNSLCKAKRKEFDLAAALHTLISNSIGQKRTLQKASQIEDPTFVKSKIECCDHIVSFSIHALLSFSWDAIFQRDETASGLVALITGTTPLASIQKDNRSSVVAQLNTAFIKKESFLYHLDPAKEKGRIESSVEILLHFLFHQLDATKSRQINSKKERYEKYYLGEKTYLALLSHMLPEPSAFYLAEKDLVQRLSSLPPFDFLPRTRLIYSEIMMNIHAFEAGVQQRIVKDTLKFLENRGFHEIFLRLDCVFEAVSGYLCKPKYLADPTMKSGLEKFYLLYMAHYWKIRRTKQSVFRDMWNFTVPEFLLLSSQLMDSILAEAFAGTMTDEGIYTLIQFVFFMEDAALRISLIQTQPQYVEVIAKLLLCLSEVRMLYFWYPSFLPGHMPRDLEFDFDEYSQREGGVMRAILKLIMGIIVRNTGKKATDLDSEHSLLALKLLSFFIFRKRKTQKRIEVLLKLSVKSPEKTAAEVDTTSFLEFTPKGSFAQSKLKMILHERCVAHQKTVEDVMKSVGGKKDILESIYYRGLLLIAEVSQALIYAAHDVSSYRELILQAKVPGTMTSVKVVYLSKVLARIIKICLAGSAVSLQKFMEELGKDLAKVPDYPIEQCFSNFDSFTKETMDAVRPHTSDYSSLPSPAKVHGKSSTNPAENEADLLQRIHRFQEECVSNFVQINDKYASFLGKKLGASEFVGAMIEIMMNERYVKVIQPGLHKLVSEDFLLVERMILAQAEGRPKVVRRVSHAKAQTKEDKKRIEKMRKLIRECNKKLSKQDTELGVDEEFSTNEKEYEELRKTVVTEHAFAIVDRENEHLYEIVGKYYAKVLARCPLHQHLSQLYARSSASGEVAFKTFVKLDPARDNLGRAMRLKRLKNPLENPSVLRGVSYIRQFFLKRVLLCSLASESEEEKVKGLRNSRDFLVPSQHEQILLKALMKMATEKQRLSVMMKVMAEESTPVCRLPSLPRSTTTMMIRPGGYAIKTCVSRSQLARECKVKIKKEKPSLETEIIHYEHSLFGIMKFSEKEIKFSSKFKNIDKPEYRLGSTRLMNDNFNGKVRKIWRYADLKRVMARSYNMIKQAVELQFNNRKSVFLVLFSETHLMEFFSILEQQVLNSTALQKRVVIVKDCKREFGARKFTEDWRKKKLSDFEYLMLINDYSSRSFQSLAQYPVFPWIIQNLSSPDISLSTTEFRNLSFPIAGITERKRAEAVKKYDNTDDFPGGRFQFGAHYLPGRAVLGYLMRLQPYTFMIYRFDAGGDCPSRHFHMLETMWNNIKIQCDNNLELIPEFYYNPEFLANHNHYSFGMKQLEDNYGTLSGQIVRVDVVALPQWAENRHHFILMNYLALEHPKSRNAINSWIDLVFGEKQQKHEAYNLFKPLTSEKSVKEREDSETKLESSDISQIAEFGHHPNQLFDKSHPAFDEKGHENSRLVFDIFAESQRYTATLYRHKEVEVYHLIRVMVKDKSNIVVVNSNNEFVKKQLVTGKSECKNSGQSAAISRYFGIYNQPKEIFMLDPQSVFTYSNDYLVTCRGNENAFNIYNFPTLDMALTVGFHKTIVNAVHLNEREDMLYTGDVDGVVAVWKVSDILHGSGSSRRPKVTPSLLFFLKHFMTDHNEAIVSLDANSDVDLYVSASRTSCVLRVASDNRYFLTIRPELVSKVKYTIFRVLLSARGYVIFHTRSAFKTYEHDMLMVYSINGEKIAQRELEESLNSILLDPHHYFLITGGTGRKLRRYCIITLKEEDLNLSIENFATFPATITSLSYVPGEKTTMLVGLANSQLYVIDFLVKTDVTTAQNK